VALLIKTVQRGGNAAAPHNQMKIRTALPQATRVVTRLVREATA
jgi:hypothetical protein